MSKSFDFKECHECGSTDLVKETKTLYEGTYDITRCKNCKVTLITAEEMKKKMQLIKIGNLKSAKEII